MSKRVSAEQIAKRPDGHYALLDPSGDVARPGLFCIIANWCKFCHILKDDIKAARKIKDFAVYHMVGDESLENEWKMRDLGAKVYPTVFRVQEGGKLIRYTGNKDVKSLVSLF